MKGSSLGCSPIAGRSGFFPRLMFWLHSSGNMGAGGPFLLLSAIGALATSRREYGGRWRTVPDAVCNQCSGYFPAGIWWVAEIQQLTLRLVCIMHLFKFQALGEKHVASLIRSWMVKRICMLFQRPSKHLSTMHLFAGEVLDGEAHRMLFQSPLKLSGGGTHVGDYLPESNIFDKGLVLKSASVEFSTK